MLSKCCGHLFTHFGKILEKSINGFSAKSQKPKNKCFLENMPYLRTFYEKTTTYFVLKFCQNVKAVCLQILAKFLEKPLKRFFCKIWKT